MPQKMDNSKECFTALQLAWRSCTNDVQSLLITLECRYGQGNTSYATGTERRFLDSLKKKQDKAFDRLYEWLDKFSPRDWESGISSAWIRDHLTYEDAVTTGEMANVPRPSYGYSDKDMIPFMAAIKDKNQS